MLESVITQCKQITLGRLHYSFVMQDFFAHATDEEQLDFWKSFGDTIATTGCYFSKVCNGEEVLKTKAAGYLDIDTYLNKAKKEKNPNLLIPVYIACRQSANLLRVLEVALHNKIVISHRATQRQTRTKTKIHAALNEFKIFIDESPHYNEMADIIEKLFNQLAKPHQELINSLSFHEYTLEQLTSDQNKVIAYQTTFNPKRLLNNFERGVAQKKLACLDEAQQQRMTEYQDFKKTFPLTINLEQTEAAFFDGIIVSLTSLLSWIESIDVIFSPTPPAAPVPAPTKDKIEATTEPLPIDAVPVELLEQLALEDNRASPLPEEISNTFTPALDAAVLPSPIVPEPPKYPKLEKLKSSFVQLFCGNISRQFSYQELLELVNAVGGGIEQKNGSRVQIIINKQACDTMIPSSVVIHSPHGNKSTSTPLNACIVKHFIRVFDQAGITPEKLWPHEIFHQKNIRPT